MPCRADSLGTGLGPMTDEDYRKMESKSGSNVNNTIKIDKLKLQELEEDLCILRDLLFKMIDDRDLPDNVEDILSDQLKKHKEHRKEDFEDIKKNIIENLLSIETSLKFREKYIKRNYDNEEEFNNTNKGKYERYEKLKKDKEIIDNISFDEFWKDRYVFNEYKKKNPSL